MDADSSTKFISKTPQEHSSFSGQNYERLKGEVFNVTDSNPRSQKATYEGLCKLLDLPRPPVGKRNPNRKRGWTHKAVSNNKILQAGWTPKHPDFLQAGISIAQSLKA